MQGSLQADYADEDFIDATKGLMLNGVQARWNVETLFSWEMDAKDIIDMNSPAETLSSKLMKQRLGNLCHRFSKRNSDPSAKSWASVFLRERLLKPFRSGVPSNSEDSFVPAQPKLCENFILSQGKEKLLEHEDHPVFALKRCRPFDVSNSVVCLRKNGIDFTYSVESSWANARNKPSLNCRRANGGNSSGDDAVPVLKDSARHAFGGRKAARARMLSGQAVPPYGAGWLSGLRPGQPRPIDRLCTAAGRCQAGPSPRAVIDYGVPARPGPRGQ
eukprot:750583-Hanusia_phi.AAC.5